MNNINSLFKEKHKNILSVYFTAGYPQLNDTARILDELIKGNTDMIEIGIPFSDPLADGPTIQKSSEIALKNGMTLNLLFEQIASSGIKQTNKPVILMGYLNPVLQFGMESFCDLAAKNNISGVIIPDLPLDEYLEHYKCIFEKHQLRNIFLITPQTSCDRIRWIDENSTGFIYMVSSAATTGKTGEINPVQEKYFKRIQEMKLKSPLLIGFGISDNSTFRKACEYANGAIIGSAFINRIKGKTDIENEIKQFIKEIKK